MNFGNVVHMQKVKIETKDFVKGGILHCGTCGSAKQCRIILFGKEQVVSCICACEAQSIRKEQEEKQAQERMESVKRLRSNSIQFSKYHKWTFAADDGKNPKITGIAKNYVKNWDAIYAKNCGLLLWGDVGTGKTFLAACIANALTDQMIPTLMTNFTQISGAMGFDGVNEYMAELKQYMLLVIDDLGAERQSDYMLERVYNIVDSRGKDGQPVIYTTNLSLQEMKNPRDIRYKRIYDRILEACVPIRFTGQSKRIQKHEEKLNEIKSLLQEG